jgi:hypothetical protein
MASWKSLQKRKFYRSDPVAFLLVERFRLSPLTFGLLSMLIGSGLYIAIAWISNTLWSRGDQVGLLGDVYPWLWILFISPTVFAYYLWSFQAIDHVVQNLEDSDVVETDEAEVDQIVLSPYYQRWRNLLALGSSVSFSIFVYYTRSGLKNSWTSSGLLPTWVVTVSTFVAVYIGSILVLNLITNVRILHRILAQKNLNINPLHPDRCGGLRPLSDYALRTAYLIGVLGVMVGLIEFQFITRGVGKEYWFVHLIIPLHLILSISCFFGPLLAAHEGMRKAKENLLHEIARQFQNDYSQIRKSLSGDEELLTKGMEKIKKLRDIYSFTDEFPVWPFEVQTFRRFLLTVPTPLIPILAGVLQKLIGHWLKQAGINFG